jgi:hypothetical protein
MSRLYYRFAYAVRFKPWEQQADSLAPQLRGLLDREEQERHSSLGGRSTSGAERDGGRWSLRDGAGTSRGLISSQRPLLRRASGHMQPETRTSASLRGMSPRCVRLILATTLGSFLISSVSTGSLTINDGQWQARSTPSPRRTHRCCCLYGVAPAEARCLMAQHVKTSKVSSTLACDERGGLHRETPGTLAWDQTALVSLGSLLRHLIAARRLPFHVAHRTADLSHRPRPRGQGEPRITASFRQKLLRTTIDADGQGRPAPERALCVRSERLRRRRSCRAVVPLSHVAASSKRASSAASGASNCRAHF